MEQCPAKHAGRVVGAEGAAGAAGTTAKGGGRVKMMGLGCALSILCSSVVLDAKPQRAVWGVVFPVAAVPRSFRSCTRDSIERLG